MLNKHYRLPSQTYFTEVKVRRPQVHESSVGIAKQLSFFEINDPYWISVIDTRLRDLRVRRLEAG